MTTSDNISLLPTVDFLEHAAKKQWGANNDYGVGFSPVVPEFFSTTNSEWLCLNSESEFLASPLGTAAFKSPFNYTRPESSPTFVALDDISIEQRKIGKAKSLFLFRIGESQPEIITVSNYDKNPDNITTAPPLNCFSRECLSWFDTNNDWYVGLGLNNNSITILTDNSSGVIINDSNEITDDMVTSSSKIPSTLIELVGLSSTSSPYVSVCFGSGIHYQGDVNTMFLYSVNGDDSLVAFAGQFTKNQTSVEFSSIDIEISFQSTDTIIV